MARMKNERLIKRAKDAHCHLTFITADLAKTNELEQLMENMIAQIPTNAESITLINNAGVVEPIGRTENNHPDEIARSVAINLTAPMILSATFINMLTDRNMTKKIVNISSGAGRKAYTGWSTYCTTKAGLDHYTRVVSAEQSTEPFGVKIISIAPGIIDTDMQATIRDSDKKDFDLLDRFIDYKKQGLLSTPKETAEKLVQLIHSKNFYALGPILDLRDF